MSAAYAQLANSAYHNDRIVAGRHEELAALTLDQRGVICECNQACEAVFDYPRNKLFRQHVSTLLPQLAEFELMQNGQPNHRLRFLSRIGHHFQARTRSGVSFASKLFFNHLDGMARDRISLIVRPAEEALPGKAGPQSASRPGGGL